MNIQEAKADLFKYFLTNTSFKLKDFNKYFLKLGDDLPLFKAIIAEAARDLVKHEVLRELTVDGETHFVLVKSLLDYEQNVVISPETASAVSMIINDYIKESGNEINHCDVMNILDSDIKNAISIMSSLANNQMNQNNGIDNLLNELDKEE